MKNSITCLLMLMMIMSSCDGITQRKLSVSPAEFELKWQSGTYQLLDVRTAGEFKAGHLKNALQADWLNKPQFEERTKHLDQSKPVLVYCASGVRSEQAAKWLLNKGFTEVFNLKGGTTAWQLEGKSLEADVTAEQMSVQAFQQQVQTNAVVLVDIGAEWCPPCKKMEPVISKLATELAGKFKLLRVDGGNDIEVMKHVKADALPTFIIYKNGKEIWRDIGIISKEILQAKITQ